MQSMYCKDSITSRTAEIQSTVQTVILREQLRCRVWNSKDAEYGTAEMQSTLQTVILLEQLRCRVLYRQ
jgi:hypothetical protein